MMVQFVGQVIVKFTALLLAVTATVEGLLAFETTLTGFVLARFVRHRFRNHQLGLFQGQCTSLHSDAWNELESYNLVIPLTRVTFGGIWIEDLEGTSQCPNLDCNLPGKTLELPASFQLSKKRCTVPWAEPLGARVVLVAWPSAPGTWRS